MEVGPVEAVGMGQGPIGWQTLAAWREQTGVDLPPWQARLLRRLSLDWLVESRRAEDERAPPPWPFERTAEMIAADERRLDAMGL